MARLPANAFEFYAGLGPERSYRAVAAHFGTSKQTVTKRARRERWPDRLAAVEREAQERAVKRARETLEEVNARHLKTLQIVQRKALEALQSMPLTTAMEAVRALDIAIGKERLVRGEPSDRTAIDIESVLKNEYQRWMVPASAEELFDDDE